MLRTRAAGCRHHCADRRARPDRRCSNAGRRCARSDRGGDVLAAATYAIALGAGLPHAQLSALAFTAIVAGNLFLILLHRSGRSIGQALRTPNNAFWIVVVAASSMLCVAILHPTVAALFNFEPPPARMLVVAVGLPLLAVVVLDLARRLFRAKPDAVGVATIPPAEC